MRPGRSPSVAPPRSRGGRGRGRIRLTLLVLLAVLSFALQAAVVLRIRGAVLDRHPIGQIGLGAAMQTFRPSEHPGLSRPVAQADLDPAKAVRSEPGHCAPLSVLSTGDALDGVSWSGAAGRPLQPVLLLSVRFADAEQARAELVRKRIALLRCSNVELTFPPFEDPPQQFGVRARTWPPQVWLNDRMAYALVTPGRRFEFYVRRYDNVVTWSYGDPEGVAVRRGIVDDLAVRLSKLER